MSQGLYCRDTALPPAVPHVCTSSYSLKPVCMLLFFATQVMQESSSSWYIFKRGNAMSHASVSYHFFKSKNVVGVDRATVYPLYVAGGGAAAQPQHVF